MKKYVLIILSLLLSANMIAEARIVKWTDKNGVTHYGDKPPMPSVSTKSKVLNNQGVTINTIDQERKDPTIDIASKAQSRKDAALLASYNSIEEIDIARDRNTRIDEIALQSLNQKLDNLHDDLALNMNSEGNSKAKKSKTAHHQIMEDRALILGQIKFTKKQITSKEESIAATRLRYDNDKVRYEALKPRSYAINSIKDKQRSLTELQVWRNQAQAKVDLYQDRMTRLKRSNKSINNRFKRDFLKAVREVERANAAISATKVAIQNSQRDLSQ